MTNDLDKLQGTWNVTSLETDGQNMPVTVFSGATIVVKGSAFRSVGMGAEYEGTLELQPTGKPRAFDLVFTAGHAKGHRNLGIYQLDGDSWTICLSTFGNTRPREFETTAGSGFALETLERSGAERKTVKRKSQPRKARNQAATIAIVEPEPAAAGPATELEGEWAMTSGIFNGVAMDQAMVKWCKRITRGCITKVMAGPQVFLHASFMLDQSQQPAAIDYLNMAGASKGKSQAGIFELKGDALHICVSAPGEPRPTDFSALPGDNRTSTQWRRVKP